MIDALENIKILLYDATSNVSYISISPLLLPDEEIRVHIDTSYIIESIYYNETSNANRLNFSHGDKLTLIDYIYNNRYRIEYMGYTELEAHSLIRKMKLANYFGDIHE